MACASSRHATHPHRATRTAMRMRRKWCRLPQSVRYPPLQQRTPRALGAYELASRGAVPAEPSSSIVKPARKLTPCQGHTSAFCAARRRDHPGAESIQWVLKAVHKPMLGTVRRWDACRDWPSSSCGRVACSLAWPWSTPSTFRTFRALVILGSAGRARIGRRAGGAVEPSPSLRPHEERITVRPGPAPSLRRRARARWHALDRGPPEAK